jgi:hypothetical protein
MKELAEKARPIDYDDLGSERQVEAFNAFTIKMEQILSKEDFERFEAFSMKATTDELIDYGLTLCGY